MTRKNKYIITIVFNNSNNKFNKQNIHSSYVGSRGLEDEIMISTSFIQIVAYRSSKINLEDIFYNHTSSMYIQIIKSIIFYYLNSSIYTDIKNIKIDRSRKEKVLNSKIINSSELSQILSSNFTPIKNKLNFQNLIKLFEDSDKGETILIASSYILKANVLTDEIEKFERLWKAFNKIYKYIGNNENENNCHRTLRTFILNNPNNFQLSTKKVASITTEELRKKLRWRALILNDFSTYNKTRAFSDFVLRYSDSRIMKVLRDTLVYRKDNLENQNLYNTTLNHINLKLQQNITLETELVSILCIKYMYFVRNKLMHGEKIDSTLRLVPNKELKELTWLNTFLEALVIDLINCNDNF